MSQVRVLFRPPYLFGMKKWVLYIVRCSDRSLYTGITTDIKERLKKHREGRGSKYIRSRRPIKLVYKKACKNESEARKLELKIKKLSQKNKIKLTKNKSGGRSSVG